MWPRCFGTSASVSAGHGTARHGPVSLLGFEIPPRAVRDVVGVLVVFVQCSALAEPPELVNDWGGCVLCSCWSPLLGKRMIL